MYLKQVPSVVKKLYQDVIWSSLVDSRLRMTFDDGPHPDSTSQLLALLKDLNIKATFFCSGMQAEKHPVLMDEIIADGHQIGSHGYRHLSGWKTNNKTYIDDIRISKDILDTNLYRPPYGRITPNQVKLIQKKLNMKTVLWTHMPGDFDNSVTEEKLRKNLGTMRHDSIAVLHDKPSCLSKITVALSKLAQKGMILETKMDI